MFGIYWISQQNVLEFKLKRLVISFVLFVMPKVQNMESIDIQSDCKTTCKERIDSSKVFTCPEKLQKLRECQYEEWSQNKLKMNI